MFEFLRRHNILLQLVVLTVALWSLSFYNYISQKQLFLQQLQGDSSDLLQSITSSINKFNRIEQTLSLNALVSSISFNLEIFDFRYLDHKGVVISSMFENEVGKLYSRPGIILALDEQNGSAEFYNMGQFYVEERDLTNVMAITFPVREGDRLFGIIDLALDVSEFDYVPAASRELLIRRLELDTTNLLNAIASSIISRTRVFEALQLSEFLSALVAQTGGVLEISLRDETGQIYAKSSGGVEQQRHALRTVSGSIRLRSDGSYEYLVQLPLDAEHLPGHNVLLAIDASDYVANERRLFYTSMATSLLAIIVAVTIVYAIYRINLRRAREENIRLEHMVEERTEELRRISQTDKLTGLANRCYLEERLELEFKRAKRYTLPLSLAVLDLDLFKNINDNFGHLAGDMVLREIGSRLRSDLRETDFVGRFGGEEFVVILTNTELADALCLAEILRCLVMNSPVHFEGQTLPITASVGVARMEPHHGSYKEIFSEADRALYQAKAQGRNCVAYADRGEVVTYVAKSAAET